MALTEPQRREILTRVLTVLDTEFASPTPPDTAALRRDHESPIVTAQTDEAFHDAVTAMLQVLGTSHLGLLHDRRPRAPGRIALAATFTPVEHTPDGPRWMFENVHPGGIAANAGIEPGDVLLTIDGTDVMPPTALPFQLAHSYTLTLRRRDQSTSRVVLDVPGSREKTRPILVPDAVVTASKLANGIGLVRVTMFPGVLGMHVARDITRAVRELGARSLIVDVRGNTGGGIGSLRLSSHLCADRRGTGYSVGRKGMQRGYTREHLPAFDRIPASKWGVIPLLPLALRLRLSGPSVAIYTEGLGPQLHHEHVAILINRHTHSSAEMVAGFARESRLATLVGVRTGGRLVATALKPVGYGYRLGFPIAVYYTWQGTNLEGRGVDPDIDEPLSTDALRQGHDNQLARAIAVLHERAN